MGVIGDYIDGLTYEERDHLVTAQGWVDGFFCESGERCLVGHVFAEVVPQPGLQETTGCNWLFDVGSPHDVAEDAFDKLCDRFGLDRIVRCVKLRAGAKLEDLRSPQTTEPREPVEAGLKSG